MTQTLYPVEFVPPLFGPADTLGLYAATHFTDTTDESEALRWLASGVRIKPVNLGFESNVGVWSADWDAAAAALTSEDVKDGERPDISDVDPFPALTLYGFDQNNDGDMSQAERLEVRTRAQHALTLREQPTAEGAFITRALADAGTPTSVDSLVEAVATIEELVAPTNTTALIHARVGLLAVAEHERLVVRDGSILRTPAGNRWVFGSGYAAASLGDTLIATSPTFGWRGPIVVRDALQPTASRYVALAERSVLIGYEAVIGAVSIA